MPKANRQKILAEITSLSNRVAVEYSRTEFEKYKQQHPHSKKTLEDPLFQLQEGQPTQQTSAPPAEKLELHEGKPETKLTEDSITKTDFKESGNKFKKAYLSKKEKIHKHLKNEVQEFKTAGAAITKFVSKEKLTDHELEAVKSAAAKVARTVISAALGGHIGASDIAEHFAVETVTDAAAEGAKPHEEQAHGHEESHEQKHKQDPAPESHPSAQPVTSENIDKIQWKKSGDKFKKAVMNRKDAIFHSLKTKYDDFKGASKAINKFVKNEPLDNNEKKQLHSAAKSVAVAAISAALGHHFGAAGIVQYFAIATVAEALVARMPKHLHKGGSMKTAKDPQDEFIEMIIENVTKQLNKLEHYSPQELRELQKKIEQSVRHDPKVRKELEEQFGK